MLGVRFPLPLIFVLPNAGINFCYYDNFCATTDCCGFSLYVLAWEPSALVLDFGAFMKVCFPDYLAMC
jgi:hypothetical protein